MHRIPLGKLRLRIPAEKGPVFLQLHGRKASFLVLFVVQIFLSCSIHKSTCQLVKTVDIAASVAYQHAMSYDKPHPGCPIEENPIMIAVAEEQDNSVAPRKGDSIFDTYQPTVPQWVLADDGLPKEVDQTTSDETLPPALMQETLVCMKQDADPEHGRSECLEKCKYYKRQLSREPSALNLRVIDRWCLHPASKGLNGAALSLRDTEVPFCELRDPPDPRSEYYLDKIDEKKIQQGKNREFFPIFKTVETEK